MEPKPEVVLSGIRATGRSQLGNYLGALEQFARLSRDPSKKCFFFVADLHTLTTLKDARLIRQQASDIVLDMLAAGVDAERSAIYMQSQVPAVTELAWYLACLTPHGELERVPTFKEKAEKHPEDVNGGLLFYPVLMAADILGPRANLVPVGRDQKPHLELTRELARKFNRLYGEYFPIPRDLGEEMLSVPGLVPQDAKGQFAKMGKSETPEQTIYLNDPPEISREKILRSPTDPARVRRVDPGTPTKCAVFSLHQLVSSNLQISWSANGCLTATISCLECKDALATNIERRLDGFRQKRAELVGRPQLLQTVLAEGRQQARAVFEETTAAVADRLGLFRTLG